MHVLLGNTVLRLIHVVVLARSGWLVLVGEDGRRLNAVMGYGMTGRRCDGISACCICVTRLDVSL